MSDDDIIISNIKKLAMSMRDSQMSDEDIRNIDVTDDLIDEINRKIKEKNLITIQIIGEVTTGKSTLAIQLMLIIAKLMKVPVDINNICGDQSEYIRKMADSKLKNTVLVIDEWNELGNTGLNATTENSLLTYYAEVQAQRYIHRISCSPSKISDIGADIILDVQSVDKDTQITNFLVSYKLVSSSVIYPQLIGYARLNVSQAIKCPFYKKYRAKKFQKIDFVIKSGVRDVREIQQAILIKEVWIELRPLTRYMKVKREVVSATVDKVRRMHNEIVSILTSEELTKKAFALLDLEREINIIKAKKKQLGSKMEKNIEEMKDEDYKTDYIRKELNKKYGIDVENLDDAYNILVSIRDSQLENYDDLEEIAKRYKSL